MKGVCDKGQRQTKGCEKRKEEARRKKRAKEEQMQDKRVKGEKAEGGKKAAKKDGCTRKRLVRIKIYVLMRTSTMK